MRQRIQYHSKKFPSWVRVIIYLAAFVLVQVFSMALAYQFNPYWRTVWFTGDYVSMIIILAFTFIVGKVLEVLLNIFYILQFERRG
ncbi:MAG: hypothetical protein V1847_02440 [Candidatus Diapherotrites archaeon]